MGQRDLDNLINDLQRQRDKVRIEIEKPVVSSTELVDKLRSLRKRAKDADETWRRVQR